MKSIICTDKSIRKNLAIQAEGNGIEVVVYLDIVEACNQEDFPKLETLHKELTK